MRWIERPRLLLLCILILGAVGVATATRVTVTGNAEGAEVCRFPARDRENPFGRWLGAPDVACVTSGSVIPFPSGLWNVFARSRSGVSIEPILVDGATAPEILNLSLVPAATLMVQLPAGVTGAVYVPKRAAAFPASERMIVPADEELWLFVVSKSGPVAIVEVSAIPAGGERTVDARNINSAPALVGWVHLPDQDRTALRGARGVQKPHISIISGGKETEALSLPAPDALGGAFILLHGVSEGPAELKLTGRGWLPYRRQVRVGPQSITAMIEPIMARASARVAVNWSTPNNLAALDRSLGSCEPQSDSPRFELTISSCATPKSPDAPADPESCQPVRTETLHPEASYGTVAIDEAPPGLYRFELRFGKLPPAAVTAQVVPLQQRPILLQPNYFGAYGSLTRGGQPLGENTRIMFPGGGVGFAPSDSDQYHAVLMQPFGSDSRIDIATCAGEHTLVITNRPMIRNVRYDIDIPDNSLTITVIDTFTHAPLSSAMLKFVVMSSLLPRFPLVTRQFQQRDGEKSGEGRFVMRSVPEREIRITVTNAGYKKKELEPFSMARSEKKEIEVQLVPLSGLQGKIVSARPFQNGTILWFSAAGTEIERADLESDGTFSFDDNHFRDETMTVISLSHPLWISRPPAGARGKPLAVRFPDAAPARDAEVSIAGMPARMSTVIGVAIGGLRVPQPALAQHMALRNSEAIVRGQGPLLIPALTETGPIDILRSPSQMLVRNLEVLAVRDFVPAATQRLMPGNRTIIFDAVPK